MRTALSSRFSCGALALAAALFVLPDRALAQVPYMGPQGNPYGGGIPGGTGNPYYNSGPGYNNNNNYNNNRNGNNNYNNGNNNGAANYNQGQGALANQSQTRNRFTLYTSITGAGVLNSSLTTVTQFGTAVGQQGQQGGGGNPYGGANGGNNQYNQTTQNGQGTLLKNPQGVVLNALYNNSTTYGIFGNQQVNQGQQGQYGNPYGGGYGNPYKGGYGNGGYGL